MYYYSYGNTELRDCQEAEQTMIRRDTPFEEALKILSGIIAQKYLRSHNEPAPSATSTLKTTLDINDDQWVNSAEEHDGEGISGNN